MPILRLQGRGDHGRNRPEYPVRGLALDVLGYPVNPVHILMISVVAQFVADIERDNQAAGHTDGEPGDVDQRIALMSQNVSDGGFNVVFEHHKPPIDLVRHQARQGLQYTQPVPEGTLPPGPLTD